MEEPGCSAIFGVLGGMGPRASAEFVRTIYDSYPVEYEQQSPIVIMYSDPALPDRTDALLARTPDRLLTGLIRGLGVLHQANAAKIVICCITAHYLLDKFPLHLREKTISLLDIISKCVLQRRERQLLICTTGARLLGVFQNHPSWDRLREFIVWPDEQDQAGLHNDLLYQIKKGGAVAELTPLVESLLKKYEVSSFIAGCTELHLLSKLFDCDSDSLKRYKCIDPLTIIARDIGSKALAA